MSSQEIRIVTGPNGTVTGSKVFINGKEIDSLTYFEVSGQAGDVWQTTMRQVMTSTDGLMSDEVPDV